MTSTATTPGAALALPSNLASNLAAALPRILQTPGAMPDDWLPTATTYDLTRFDNAVQFSERLVKGIAKIVSHDLRDGAAIAATLHDCGLPYDYARLGQPLSTLFELWVQAQTHASRVFSFASVTKPWLAVIEAPERKRPVQIFAEGTLPISAAMRADLATRQVTIGEQHVGAVPASVNPEAIVVVVLQQAPVTLSDLDMRHHAADAVCYPVTNGGMLLVRDETKLSAHGIQVVRKRTVSALLAADAYDELWRVTGARAPAAATATNAEALAALQQLFPQIASALVFCTGLAAEAAVFAATAAELGPGPVSFFYAANGYGGTGQLISDLLAPTTNLVPAPLPVMDVGADGKPRTLVDGIVQRLTALQGADACVFIETPTNPQLQVHDMAMLIAAVRAYRDKWGKTVPVLVDTTLAPLYPALSSDVAQDWPFLLIKSGSKYFTKGKTTLGVAAASAHPLTQAIMQRAAALGRDADAFAKPGQLAILCEGLRDLKPRMAAIASATTKLALGIKAALAARGQEITLYAMTPAEAAQGLACGLISFYLPPAVTTYPDLVDEFVASVLANGKQLAKSRVSYGQSTGGGARDWFYVINPEESTQGALSAEVKNAQKRNNVQICRISVPANGDVDGLLTAMEPFFDQKYGPRA